MAKFNGMPRSAEKAPEAIEFGAAVRERRKAKGWTQEQLAEAARVSALQIGFVERGENMPKLRMILRIARAFRVRPGELIDHIRVR